MKRTLLATVLLVANAPFALADEFRPAMENYLQSNVASWVADPVLVEAIKAHNATSSSYTQSEIDAMDQQWRAEVGTASAPLVDGVLSNPASDFLRSQVEASGGTITEAFVMDARGLNVAASDATSDMWQGDEEKFTQTYAKGAGGIHFSEVEFDESTQRYQGQISVSVVDAATGEVVGAITIGVDAEALL